MDWTMQQFNIPASQAAATPVQEWATEGTGFVQVSISSTFYPLVFCRYPFAKKSQSLMFQLLIFGAKILYEKSAHKMLMKHQHFTQNFFILNFFVQLFSN